MRARHNFLPALFLAVLFWISWFVVIFDFAPEIRTYFPFFLSLFFALTLTLALILANTRRAFFVSAGIIAFLILRLFELANYLNLILILSFFLSLEIYFSCRRTAS